MELWLWGNLVTLGVSRPEPALGHEPCRWPGKGAGGRCTHETVCAGGTQGTDPRQEWG